MKRLAVRMKRSGEHEVYCLIFDTVTRSVLIFKLRKRGVRDCGLKHGCTARVKEHKNQWPNSRLKASTERSVVGIFQCLPQ